VVQFQHLDRTLSALADPTRRAILEQLRASEASISELAEPLGISLTGVRKQVALLEDAGLVTTQKVGRVRRCRLGAPQQLENVSDWIAAHRQVMAERFDRFGELLEREKGMDR
jgi:DNA-binding transcriptional ArsR family regulator